MYSHTWWWTEWPDFLYPQRHLCRWRSAVHQSSISLLLQPVMESILSLDVRSIGSESEKVLWFNLLCLSLSISLSPFLSLSLFPSPNRSIHPSLHFVILSLRPPRRLALSSLSYRLSIRLALSFLSLLVFSSLSLSLSLSLPLSPSLFLSLSPLSWWCGSSRSWGTMIRTEENWL